MSILDLLEVVLKQASRQYVEIQCDEQQQVDFPREKRLFASAKLVGCLAPSLFAVSLPSGTALQHTANSILEESNRSNGWTACLAAMELCGIVKRGSLWSIEAVNRRVQERCKQADASPRQPQHPRAQHQSIIVGLGLNAYVL